MIFESALQDASAGKGVTLILADANGQHCCFIRYDYSFDEGLDAENMSKDLLLTLVQWLGENRYLPTSDNKTFLVRGDAE